MLAYDSYIDDDELSGERFSLKDSIKESKGFIQLLNLDNGNFIIEFEDNIWILKNHITIGGSHHIKFEAFETLTETTSYFTREHYLAIKCWTALNLTLVVPTIVQMKLNKLYSTIVTSNLFDLNKLNEFLDYIDSELLIEGSNLVFYAMNASISFIQYLHLDCKEYVYQMKNIKKNFPATVKTRDLPDSKSILDFHSVITEYFIDGFKDWDKIYYAPILLWWKISNIIPLRPSEFCKISRDGLIVKDDKFYLKLPRIKSKQAARKIQVIDTIEITKEIYDLIYKYKVLTSSYGNTKTLISWRALNDVRMKRETRIYRLSMRDRKKIKTDRDYFNISDLRRLLVDFEYMIIKGKYNIHLKSKILPIHTRHFAFCSLLMQGVSPIEIARLGGHTTIEAQYHYMNHTDYYIDFEVKKLLDQYKFSKLQPGSYSSNKLFKEVEYKSFLSLKERQYMYKLDVGYCIDQKQRCQSEECMLCDYWWISTDELLEKKKIINEKISERREKIKELGVFLKNFNNTFKTMEMISNGGINKGEVHLLESTKAAIEDHLNAIARLEIYKGSIN